MTALLTVAICVVGLVTLLDLVVWLATRKTAKKTDTMIWGMAVTHLPALVLAIVALALELAR